MTTDTRDTPRSLIASDRVEGTSVRGEDGEDVGTIERLMIDKATGRVAYAVLSFGGILGIKEGYRALPWDALRYDPEADAYRAATTEAELRGAPDLDGDGRAVPDDRNWEETLHAYYRARPYWGI